MKIYKFKKKIHAWADLTAIKPTQVLRSDQRSRKLMFPCTPKFQNWFRTLALSGLS